jgi:uncharacterized membrane protein
MDEWNRSQPDSLFCLSMSWAAWLLSPSDLWVWLAILLLLASGYWMLFTTFGGFVGAGPYIHLMQMIGWLMIALFVWRFHGPWLTFKRAVDAEDWPSAGATLNRIRQIIAVNLPLGLLVVVIGGSGRYGG